MTDGTQSQAQEQNKKQYNWLDWYKFVKGASGNPWGRPKGSKSLKQFAKEYLELLPPEEKIAFLSTLPSEIIWRMSEGNPHVTQDVTSNGETLQPVLVKFIDGTKNDWDTSWI